MAGITMLLAGCIAWHLSLQDLFVMALDWSPVPPSHSLPNPAGNPQLFQMKPADLPKRPPECFNCKDPADQCMNFGSCDSESGYCLCPRGFGGQDCLKPMCGSLFGERHPKPDNETSCACKDGWTGINCNVCQLDSVCQDFDDPVTGRRTLNGTCYKHGVVQYNGYHSCAVKNQPLIDILGGLDTDVTFECHRDPLYCTFQFWVAKNEAFFCYLSECSYSGYAIPDGDMYNVECKQAKCDCPTGAFLCGADGSIDLSDMLHNVTGPGTLACQEPGFENGKYDCEFDEPLFRANLGPFLGKNAKIILKCDSGECLANATVAPLDPYVPGVSTGLDFSTILIVSLVGVLALAAVGACIAMMVIQARKRQRYRNTAVQFVDDEMEKLMEGHHVPATLTFRDIRYEVINNGASKRVLKGISGIVKPGEVMAVMGPSGAGKTSCLDILAGRSKSGLVSGEILVNGRKPSRALFKRMSGYVDQEDTMFPTLTVYETILFSALLRLPKTMSLEAKKVRVHDAMAELGIEHIANSRIGSTGRRAISGGEKRRVSIAMELVGMALQRNPQDRQEFSYNALSVVHSIVSLAKRYNRTVIMTIHQPRSNIFSLFDKLLLLAEGGHMVYSGPVTTYVAESPSSDSPNLFSEEKLGVSPNYLSHQVLEKAVEVARSGNPILGTWLQDLGVGCPPGFNIADFLIDLTKIGGLDESTAGQKARLGRIDGQSLLSPLRRRRAGDKYSRFENQQSSSSTIPASKDEMEYGSPQGRSHSPGRVRLNMLPSPAVAGKVFGDVDFVPIDAVDLAELQSSDPHLAYLVLGFRRSQVCKLLRDEIESSLRARRPKNDSHSDTIPIPSSASIQPRNSAGDLNEDDDDTPLLKGPVFGPGAQAFSSSSKATGYGLPTAVSGPSLSEDCQNVEYYEQMLEVDSMDHGDNVGYLSSLESLNMRPSVFVQFYILSGRALTNFYRDPMLMFAHYGISVVFAVFMGVVYWHISHDMTSFQDRIGLFLMVFLIFGLGSMTSLELFSRERVIFIRERACGYYNVTIYFLTKILFDMIPLRVVPALLLGGVMYYMVGLMPGYIYFLKFLLVLVLFNLTTAANCLLVGVAFPAMGLSILASVLNIILGMLFGGFFLNSDHVPWVFSWLPYLSSFKYAFEAVMVNELNDITLEDSRLGIRVPGPVILQTFGFEPLNYWWDVIRLGLLFLANLLATFVLVQLLVRERR